MSSNLPSVSHSALKPVDKPFPLPQQDSFRSWRDGKALPDQQER